MSRLFLSAAMLALGFSACGCGTLGEVLGRTGKVGQPVMGPPPPRRSLVQAEDPVNSAPGSPGAGTVLTLTGDESDSAIQTASLDGAGGNPFGPASNPQANGPQLQTFRYNEADGLPDSQIVATVNGKPIYAGDVLERYASFLRDKEPIATEAQMLGLRKQLIRQDLEVYIERELLAMALRASLEDEQLQQISTQMEAAFDDRINALRKEFQVNTTQEVEQKLREAGSSLESLKSLFQKQALAAQYLNTKVKLPEIGRPDIFARYRQDKEDYFQPARVKWQQILVSFSQNGGRDGARQKLAEVVKELQAGRNFADVAREHSDSVTAKDGGVWDWMAAGSLADVEVEQALFELPVGQVSQIFTTETDFQLVRVLERKAEHYTPFEDVQEEIEKAMNTAAREEATDRVVKELKAQAIIETIFDGEEKPAGA